MNNKSAKFFSLIFGLALFVFFMDSFAGDLGGGYTDHGVAAAAACSRGLVATQDGKGRSVVLVWLYDCRGGYALLEIDVDTGKSEQFPTPFPFGGDAPFFSLLSSGNKYYTHFGSHFCEYDPAQRAFTFITNTAPKMAMSMTEDDHGTIWSATYPQSGLVSFDPKTRVFKDYGQVYKQNWAQYPSGLSVDDAGWVYWGIGNAACQVIAFDPSTKTIKPLVAEGDRRPGGASAYRAENGRVYSTLGRPAGWSELHAGAAIEITNQPPDRKEFGISGNQGLFHVTFPDNRRLANLDLDARILVVANAGAGVSNTVRFNYTSQGAPIMGVEAAPDKTICGGTTFPARFFSFNPATDRLSDQPALGQWNTVARQGDRFYVGAYTGGRLLEWNPARKWVDTKPGDTNSNPLLLTECRPDINRPHVLLPYPDGKTIVMGGTPGYGRTGGGLLFWDHETGSRRLLSHTNVIADQATLSLAPLPGGKLLGGTTTAPGTGGIKKAEVAELYVMDIATAAVEWHQQVLPGVQSYTALIPGGQNRIYGFADRRRFFVFDTVARRIVHESDVFQEFGLTVGGQGPRVFVPGKNNAIYILFNKGIAELDQKTFAISLLAESPVPIGMGGAYMGENATGGGLDDVAGADALGGVYMDDRIYFANGSHLYSFKIPDRAKEDKK